MWVVGEKLTSRTIGAYGGGSFRPHASIGFGAEASPTVLYLPQIAAIRAALQLHAAVDVSAVSEDRMIDNASQIKLWKCRCGTRYRALSERIQPPESIRFACPTCGTESEIDGKQVQISYQDGEAWLKLLDQ